MYNTNDDLRDILKKLDATDKAVLTEDNASPKQTAKKEKQSKLSVYMNESERKMSAPVTGDVLEMIVNEEVVIEMPVINHDGSSYTLGTDSVAESFFSACGCQLDEAYESATKSHSGKPLDLPDDTWLEIINTNNPQENITQMKDFRYGYEDVEGQDLKVSKMKNDLIYIEASGGDFAIAKTITPQQAMKLSRDGELDEAEYQGRDVELNQPMRGDVKKFKVYVSDPDTGNIKKVNFGSKDMEIKRDDPDARKSFRARHKCDQKSAKNDRDTAGYWSCKMWQSSKSVSDILAGK